MDVTFKKVLCLTLIAFYSFSAAAGNIIVLRELLNSGDQQHQQLTSEKKSRHIPDSPVSIVKTHILPTIDSGHSFHIAPTNVIPVIAQPSVLFVNVEIALIYSSLEFLPSKPRDPPLS